MPQMRPCIWLDHEAEEAANFYVSVFKNAKILSTTYYPETGQEITHKAPGSVLTVEVDLDGNQFVLLNGGKVFTLTPAISFIIDCPTQADIDYYWDRLSAVPEAEQCGWVCDKFGVSWQIAPPILDTYLRDKDKDKRERVMGAMMAMKKLDIAKIEQAYAG